MSILTGILTLYGLGMGGWLAGTGMKSALDSIGEAKRKPVSIDNRVSPGGKASIEEACFFPDTKKFAAKVVCPEIDFCRYVIADSKEELERKVLAELKNCDERIRDQINKRAARKTPYFRIG